MVSFSSEESRTDEWKDAGCWLGATKVQGSGMLAAGSYRHQLLKGKVSPARGRYGATSMLAKCLAHVSR